MRWQIAVGSVLTVAGLIGVFTSFIIQKSDFDPTAFGIAIASIFIAVVGISFILEKPKTDANAPGEPP